MTGSHIGEVILFVLGGLGVLGLFGGNIGILNKGFSQLAASTTKKDDGLALDTSTTESNHSY